MTVKKSTIFLWFYTVIILCLLVGCSQVATATETATSEDITSELQTTEFFTSEYSETETASETDAFESSAEKIGLSIDYVEIDLPTVQNTYDLLFINDMHILKLDDTIAAEMIETVQARQDNMFKTGTGLGSAETWLELSGMIDDLHSDALILGGDIMDFTSVKNVQILSNGLSQIATPYMYLRADHDFATIYSGDVLQAQDVLDMHSSICSNPDVYVMEFPEFYVLGWNNSTSPLTDNGLSTIQSIWDTGKPILLATHVPVNSIVDKGLAASSMSADPQGRIKLWGNECLYRPNLNTKIFLDMLYASDSPVKAIFSGHLHYKYTVKLTDQTTEYVFAPAFAGNIAKIKIK